MYSHTEIFFMDEFSMKKLNANICVLLLEKNKRMSVQHIANRLNKHRSTIQKSISELFDLGFIDRAQINLDRGFMFVYGIKNPTEMLSRIDDNILGHYMKIGMMYKKCKK